MKGQPLPTLRRLINDNKRLLVFAEQGGSDAPPWYMPAYDDWFQETDYAFPGLDKFNCQPNRGKADNPLFLVNHWVKASPPDPGVAQKANQQDVLDKRLTDCLEQRGMVPNVVAVDFAERGDLVSYTKEVNDDIRPILEAMRGAKEALSSTTTSVTTTTTTVPQATTSVPPTTAPTTPTTEPKPSVQITDLSGGDPTSFCAAYDSGIASVVAWALASISSPYGQQGLVDLAYAPLLDRDFLNLYNVAPTALANQAKPFTERIERAMAELRSLGVTQQRIDRLAETASEQLNSPDNPDEATIELNLVSQLNGMLSAQIVTDAANRLTNAGGGP